VNEELNISIIVTTYNRCDVLRRVLLALAQQESKNFEVIVADDGSDDETKKLIVELQQICSYQIKHIWQPHEGFRAGVIRNKAAECAIGNYLIFLDGDCLPTKTFTKTHALLAEKGFFVAGNRILLSQQFSAEVLSHNLKIEDWSFWRFLLAYGQRKINRILPFINLPFYYRKLRKERWQGVKSCNLGMWRADFRSVYGFDPYYKGWGFEDSNLVVRLLEKNVLRKDGNFGVPVIHFWHPPQPRVGTHNNWQHLRQLVDSLER
jgi:glycosyltransferase involved in cell wall biosynthesis